MKLTIFGASSPTGKLLVDKALARGHEVIAFVRDEAKLKTRHPNLQVRCGDALNESDVEAAIQGCNAVLSMLGPKGKPMVMAAQSTKNIVKAMERQNVRRLVLVSVAGVAVPQDERGRSLIDSLLKFLLKDVFADRETQLAVLQSSMVDWVAVRVPRLTDEPGTGSAQAFFGNPSPNMKVTRADLADFMLEQLTSEDWLKKAPILRN